jgi:ankyrin repeat protein
VLFYIFQHEGSFSELMWTHNTPWSTIYKIISGEHDPYIRGLNIDESIYKRGAQFRYGLDSDTPLVWTIKLNEYIDTIEIARLLVKNGADVDLIDKYGITPLHIAVRYNIPDLVSLLVEKGADVNIENDYGFTPLILAVHLNNVEMVRLLVEEGVDVNIKNVSGVTALDLAIKLKRKEIADFLRKHV